MVSASLGQKSMLLRKLERLRKLTYAGQLVQAGDGTEAAPAAVPMQDVLSAVLDDNSQLRTRIEQLQARPAIPDQFACPILGDVMQDPVIANDGHTYDRAAIETWFQRSDRSPMTNLPIPRMLIPNLALRQMTAAIDNGAGDDNDSDHD